MALDSGFVADFVKRLGEAIDAHDADAIAALCSEDVIWLDPATPQPLHGRAAVCAFHRDGLFRAIPDVHFEIVDGPYFAQEGQRVAVRTRLGGTMTGPLAPPGFAPTGRHVEFETAEFWVFDGELLSRNTVVLDMLALARQIGAVSAPGSFGERMMVQFQHLMALLGKHR